MVDKKLESIKRSAIPILNGHNVTYRSIDPRLKKNILAEKVGVSRLKIRPEKHTLLCVLCSFGQERPCGQLLYNRVKVLKVELFCNLLCGFGFFVLALGYGYPIQCFHGP